MSRVFPDIIKSLKESFRNEQQSVIKRIGKNLVLYLSDNDSLSKDDSHEINQVLEGLTSKFGYRRVGAISMIQFLLKKKY